MNIKRPIAEVADTITLLNSMQLSELTIPIARAHMLLTVGTIADALKDAQIAHHAYEQSTGHTDPNWADWYAAYLLGRENKLTCPNCGARKPHDQSCICFDNNCQ